MKLLLVLLSVLFFAGYAQEGISEDFEEILTEVLSEDRGKEPWVTDIEGITVENTLFREARWTGDHLQMTLMSIPVGGQIGGEVHHHNDQFIRIEQGTARVLMGESAENITFDKEVTDDWAVFIPAGYWHNMLNVGDVDLKVYSIYGPPEHPYGTVHATFKESEEAHHH